MLHHIARNISRFLSLRTASIYLTTIHKQTESMTKHIAIIGAGAAGLSAARHSLAAGHRVTVFEQAERLGGTWVYRDTVGIDATGLDVQSSMYEGLV